MVQSFSTGYYQGTVSSTSNIVGTSTCHNSIASNGNISFGQRQCLIVRSIGKQNKHCFFMKSLKKNGQSNPVNATLNEIVQLTEA